MLREYIDSISQTKNTNMASKSCSPVRVTLEDPKGKEKTFRGFTDVVKIIGPKTNFDLKMQDRLAKS